MSFCWLQKRPAPSTQDLQGTCTSSRASSSWVASWSSLPRTLPCSRPRAMPSSWVRPLKHGWTTVYGPSGLRASCALNRLPPALHWDSAPKPPGARCPQTPSLNWAQSKAMGASGSPRTGKDCRHHVTCRKTERQTCTGRHQANQCEHSSRAHKQ